MPQPADAKTASYKVSKRRELDISAVSASFFVRVDPATHLITAARLAFPPGGANQFTGFRFPMRS